MTLPAEFSRNCRKVSSPAALWAGPVAVVAVGSLGIRNFLETLRAG